MKQGWKWLVVFACSSGCGPEVDRGADGDSEGETEAALEPGQCREAELPAPLCDEGCVGKDCCAACSGEPECRGLDGQPGYEAIATCVEGACVELTPCEGACIADPEVGVRCSETATTCEEVASLYQDNRSGQGMSNGTVCGDDADCHIVAGHCGMGLGGVCWEWGAPVHTTRLAALAARWTELGCEGGSSCTDCEVPSGSCETGTDAPSCMLE